MSPPFANGTEGELFMANRCQRCVHWDHEDDVPCDDFDAAYFGEWPEIFYKADTNILGVECRKFEAVLV